MGIDLEYSLQEIAVGAFHRDAVGTVDDGGFVCGDALVAVVDCDLQVFGSGVRGRGLGSHALTMPRGLVVSPPAATK